MAEITDYFGKASVDDDHSVATTVSADRAAGVTVLSGFDLSTFTEDTPVFFITYTKTTDPLTSAVTISDLISWKGLVNAGASTITNLTVAPGYTDTGNTEGQFIECIPTSYWENQLIDGIQQEHNPDGTHSAITATSINTSGNANIGGDVTISGSLTIDGINSSGYEPITGSISAVTANGNRSYTLTTSDDNTALISPGMRVRTTRTVAAPTQCADLDSSSSQYFSKASATGFATGTTWTFKAKVKIESYSGASYVICALDDGTNLVQMYVNGIGRVVVGGGTTAAQDTVTSYTTVPLGKWVDITGSITIGTPTGEIRFDDKAVPSYVTGSAATTVTISGDETLYIGRNSVGNYFNGKIAQVAIFNAIISDATLKTYSSQTMTGSETNCKGFWSLNGVLTDASASANTLTAGGGALATNADSPFGGQADGTISSTLDYGIIQAVTASTITVQVAEGCTIPTSGGVSALAYSSARAPFGFPSSKHKWVVEMLLSGQYTVAASTSFVNINGLSVTIPVGQWVGGYKTHPYADRAGTVDVAVYFTISTSSSAESDAYLTTYQYTATGAAGNLYISTSTSVNDYQLNCAAETPLYVLLRKNIASNTLAFGYTGGITNVTFYNAYL